MDSTQQSPTEPMPSLPQLRIDGLVARACSLTAQELAHLPRQSVTEWLPNPYDGVTVQETWRGVQLIDVLHLAQPLPAAQYVRVHAGTFIVPIALDEAANALLVDMWNDQPLTVAYIVCLLHPYACLSIMTQIAPFAKLQTEIHP